MPLFRVTDTHAWQNRPLLLLLLYFSGVCVAGAAAVAPNDSRKGTAGAGPTQCSTNQRVYDITFVGPQQMVQVGTIRFAYHKFGPLSQAAGSRGAAASTAADSDISNSGSKPPLVMIVGAGATMYWWPVTALRALAADREIIMFDNPGIGNSRFTTSSMFTPVNSSSASSHSTTNSSNLATNTTSSNKTQPPGQFTIQDVAATYIQFITALKLPTKPDILGLSLGGFIASEIATHHGDAVHDVVVVCSRAGGPEIPVAPPAAVPVNIAQLATNFTEFFKVTAEGMFPERLKDPGYCELKASYDAFSKKFGPQPPIDTKVLTAYGSAVGRYTCDASVTPALGRIRNRMMFLSGLMDKWQPISVAVKSASLIPGAWLVSLAGAGHGLAHQYPNKFARIVTQFLDLADPLTEVAAQMQKYKQPAQCQY